MVEAELREAAQRWRKHPDSVYDSTVIAYGRAAMRWAGIEGRDAELDVQARRLGTIVEGFAHVDLDHLRSWRDRRLYPFVPMLPAFARTDFEFEGEQVKECDRILIDILNTNADPNSWERADQFDPERFLDVDFEQITSFVPQGGMDVATGHRCPGEKIAVGSLASTIAVLCEPEVEILPDGLDFSWKQMPTRPESGGLVTAHG